MSAEERAELAWQAYQRAVAAARTRSTPSRWARLLRAAKNLRAANAERDLPLARRGGRPLPLGAARSGAPGRRRALGRGAGVERWPELAEIWARSRALMAWSRRLVEQSRALGVNAALRARP